MLSSLIFTVLAYFIGSINSSILICKVMRLPDPRTMGSKNPGTTNVLRTGSKKAAILTLVGDVGKGFVAVLLAKLFVVPMMGLGCVAIAVTLGHIFPIFFEFKGGKGVTTAIGSILCLNALLALALIGLWLMTAATFRYSSLAAIVAAVAAPVLGFCFGGISLALPLLILCMILLWRHSENIHRLYHQTETKISF